MPTRACAIAFLPATLPGREAPILRPAAWYDRRRDVTLAGIHVDRLVDGRIAERAESVDLLALLRQIGARVVADG
jgi:hypothetical protein